MSPFKIFSLTKTEPVSTPMNFQESLPVDRTLFCYLLYLISISTALEDFTIEKTRYVARI